MCISISIIYLFLLWVDIHGFHKVISYYYAFLSDCWKASLQLHPNDAVVILIQITNTVILKMYNKF